MSFALVKDRTLFDYYGISLRSSSISLMNKNEEKLKKSVVWVFWGVLFCLFEFYLFVFNWLSISPFHWKGFHHHSFELSCSLPFASGQLGSFWLSQTISLGKALLLNSKVTQNPARVELSRRAKNSSMLQ